LALRASAPAFPHAEVALQVISPLFMNTLRDEEGGAAGKVLSHLRPNEIKSVMRYWFRAAALGLTRDGAKVRELEGDVFGASAEGAGARLLLVPLARPPASDKGHELPPGQKSSPGLKYLAFGRTPRNAPALEPALMPETQWRLRLARRRPQKREATAEARRLQLALDALWLATHLGGFGGRSRRGFGALAITDWRVNSQGHEELPLPPLCWQADGREQCLAALREGLTLVREHLGATLCGMGAPAGVAQGCSTLTGQIILGGDSGDWKEALEEAGECLRSYRSEKSGHGPSWSNDAKLKRWLLGDKAACPATVQRAAFGLPWKYRSNSVQEHYLGKSLAQIAQEIKQHEKAGQVDEAKKLRDLRKQAGDKASTEFNVGSAAKQGRRASPLVISLTAHSNGTAICPVVTHLRGSFLPDKATIGGRCHASGWAAVQAGGEVVSKYLDHLVREHGCDEVTP